MKRKLDVLDLLQLAAILAMAALCLLLWFFLQELK